jgi:hypothetical protein
MDTEDREQKTKDGRRKTGVGRRAEPRLPSPVSRRLRVCLPSSVVGLSDKENPMDYIGLWLPILVGGAIYWAALLYAISRYEEKKEGE